MSRNKSTEIRTLGLKVRSLTGSFVRKTRDSCRLNEGGGPSEGFGGSGVCPGIIDGSGERGW